MYLNFRFQAHVWRNKYYFFKEYSSFQKGLRLGLISRPDQTRPAWHLKPPAPSLHTGVSPSLTHPSSPSPSSAPTAIPPAAGPRGHTQRTLPPPGAHMVGVLESGVVPTTPCKAPWLPQLTLGQSLCSGCHQPPRLPTRPDYQ